MIARILLSKLALETRSSSSCSLEDVSSQTKGFCRLWTNNLFNQRRGDTAVILATRWSHEWIDSLSLSLFVFLTEASGVLSTSRWQWYVPVAAKPRARGHVRVLGRESQTTPTRTERHCGEQLARDVATTIARRVKNEYVYLGSWMISDYARQRVVVVRLFDLSRLYILFGVNI